MNQTIKNLPDNTMARAVVALLLLTQAAAFAAVFLGGPVWIAQGMFIVTLSMVLGLGFAIVFAMMDKRKAARDVKVELLENEIAPHPVQTMDLCLLCGYTLDLTDQDRDDAVMDHIAEHHQDIAVELFRLGYVTDSKPFSGEATTLLWTPDSCKLNHLVLMLDAMADDIAGHIELSDPELWEASQ